jgi:RHS repeat-associated protein
MIDSEMICEFVENDGGGGDGVNSASSASRIVTYGYTLDKLNRDSMSDNGAVTTYAHNALNQYTNTANFFEYDNNFNLRRTTGYAGIFDAANRLVSASNDNAGFQQMVAEFVYDGLGRCVKRTFNGVATILIYDGWKPIAEFDAWDRFQAWNVYGPGPDEILLRQRGEDGYLRFGLDRHGNVAFLFDNDGRMQEKYTYDVFGGPTITGPAGDIRGTSYYGHCFFFQGREYIPEIGIYDYRNRFYHPATGRFLQIDPTGFDADDMNLFRYCGDDPIDQSDPMGLDTTIVGVPIAGSDGAVRWTVTPEQGQPFTFKTNVFGNASAQGSDPFGQNGPLPPGEYKTYLYDSPKFDTTVIKLYTEGEGNEPTEKNDHTATIVRNGQQRKDLEFHPYHSRTEKRPTDKEVAKAEKDRTTRDKLDKEFAGSRSEGCPTTKLKDLQKPVNAIKKTTGSVILRKFSK